MTDRKAAYTEVQAAQIAYAAQLEADKINGTHNLAWDGIGPSGQQQTLEELRACCARPVAQAVCDAVGGLVHDVPDAVPVEDELVVHKGEKGWNGVDSHAAKPVVVPVPVPVKPAPVPYVMTKAVAKPAPPPAPVAAKKHR